MASPSCCALQNASVMALPVTPGIMEGALAITLPSWTYKRRISDKVPSSVPSLQHRSPSSLAVGLERKGKATCAICWVTVRGKTCDVHRFAGLQEIHQSKFSVPYIKVHSYFAFPQTALSAHPAIEGNDLQPPPHSGTNGEHRQSGTE